MRRRMRRGLLFRHGFRRGDGFLSRNYFRSFGDDDLRLLTSLGEDCDLGGGALFVPTGRIAIGIRLGRLNLRGHFYTTRRNLTTISNIFYTVNEN